MRSTPPAMSGQVTGPSAATAIAAGFWRPRVGALDLKIPKFRSGQSCYPGFILERPRLLVKALTAVIHRVWINGVSSRRVEELGQAMGVTGISKSQVSKLRKEIDERVTSFLERPLEGSVSMKLPPGANSRISDEHPAGSTALYLA